MDKSTEICMKIITNLLFHGTSGMNLQILTSTHTPTNLQMNEYIFYKPLSLRRAFFLVIDPTVSQIIPKCFSTF